MKSLTCPTCGSLNPKLTPAEIGRYMQRYRESRHLDQVAVARQLGVSTSYLCKLEQGRRQWNMQMISAFQNAVNHLKQKGKQT